MSRIDDVINVAGHRLETGRIEEVVNNHPEVVECAVIGLNDQMKGQVPVALVVTKHYKDHHEEDNRCRITMANEMNLEVREQIGAFSRLEGILYVDRLPKTRSGKILRRTMKDILNGDEYKEPATIDDVSVLKEIEQFSLAKGYDEHVYLPN